MIPCDTLTGKIKPAFTGKGEFEYRDDLLLTAILEISIHHDCNGRVTSKDFPSNLFSGSRAFG